MLVSLAYLPPWSIGLLAALVAVLLGYRLFLLEEMVRGRMARRVQAVTSEESPLRERSAGEERLLAAGLDWGQQAESRFLLLRFACALVAFLLVGAWMPLVLGLAVTLAAFMAPAWYIDSRGRARIRAIEGELPMALGRIASLVEIQPDIAQVLSITADSLAVGGTGPLADELRRTVADYRNQGIEALQHLERRAATPGLANLAAALRVYATAGGEFAPVLSAAADRAGQLAAGRNEAISRAGGARMTAILIPCLLAFVGLFVLRDPQVRAFYTSLPGQVLALLVIGAMAAGYQVIEGMVEGVA